jgi:SAM-dependent methyltransferase
MGGTVGASTSACVTALQFHTSTQKRERVLDRFLVMQHHKLHEMEPTMTDLWEPAFAKSQLMWGLEPAKSALLARDHFAQLGVKNVLIPGVGYGRNARPFLELGMSVTGIEISQTAIALARSQLKLDIPIHHGSVTDMPYDDRQYDGIFCYGLIYLLDARGREKLIADCSRQLTADGHMVFTVISKAAPMHGRGNKLGDDWYEIIPDMKLYFYDDDAVRREFGTHGLVDFFKVEEPASHGASLPFIHVVCEKLDVM